MLFRPATRNSASSLHRSKGSTRISCEECLEKLIHKAHGLGATALVALQLVQSQFQWNQRTSLLATAVRQRGGGVPA